MKSNKELGFTLIELSIYITLVAGILIMATSFAWNIINSRTKSVTIRTVEQNGRYILEKISQSVHQSIGIVQPAVGASGSQLELNLSEAPADPTIFSRSGNKLNFQRGVGPLIQMHSDQVLVTDLDFTSLSSPDGKTRNIQVNLTLEHANPDQRQAWEYRQDFSTIIELRDY